jgi:hypothetical protein
VEIVGRTFITLNKNVDVGGNVEIVGRFLLG